MELLPEMLDEWRRIDVADHLSWESPEIIGKRRRQIKTFEKAVRDLLQAVDALDGMGRFLILRESRPVGPQPTWQAAENERRRGEKEFKKILNSLKGLASTKASSKLQIDVGRPRNRVAYLVIRDVADIFEWATKHKAKRVVHDGEEAGPFYEFVAAVWPVVFGQGDDGLPSAVKNWATGGGFAVRQLYTDQDEVLFDAQRPVILNGIEDVVDRPDLADRAIRSMPSDRRS
jgi:hypothetical protein